MAEILRWILPGRVIHRMALGTISINDFFEANLVQKQMMKAVPHKVYIIFEVQEVSHYPTSIRELRAAADPLYDDHVPDTFSIFVGAGALLRLIIDTSAMIFDLNFHHVKTLEEAIQYLQKLDPSLGYDQWIRQDDGSGIVIDSSGQILG
ncbi:hypothetical protein MASR2M15_15320 [Anaerolineales bacterium]